MIKVALLGALLAPALCCSGQSNLRAIVPSGGLGGGGQIGQHTPGTPSCITPDEHARAREAIRRYEATYGSFSSGSSADAPPLYAFFPQAGTLDRDLFIGNFVDQDPTGGIRDYECSSFSYDTHAGHDCGVRNFSEQDIGVPIFAAADGVVVEAEDGNPDKSTTWDPKPANHVILDHGSNRYGYYWHMQKDSVAVVAGQVVKAGQQIGRTGSSGVSAGPHLHFENRDLPSFAIYEPFAGTCRPGASGWSDQPPLRRAIYAIDGAVTNVDIRTVPPHPYALPGGGQMAFSDGLVYIWVNVANLPAMSNWRMRFIRPNGTVSYESPQFDFGNPSFIRAQNPYWFNWNIPELRSITGNWKVDLDINGSTLVTFPFIVVPTRDPSLNRPPAAPTAVGFDPPTPKASDVVFCRVTNDLVNDDPDYDIVRYRYEWYVDGVKVRDVTNASSSDAVPRNTAAAGQKLRCTVTPGDGKVTIAPITIEKTLGGGCKPDVSGDGKLVIQDFSAFQNLFALGDLRADYNGDGKLDIQDFTAFQNGFAIGCP